MKADVRVISATNQNLEEKVKKETFREDLYYRLNVVSMTIPPLRDRRGDISILTEHFIKRFSSENDKNIEGVSSEAMDTLMKYDYPGNVRELENIIERAVVITRDHVISIRDLPFDTVSSHHFTDQKEGGTLKNEVESLEREMIERALNEAGNNQTKAAELLGITERTLRYKLKKHGFKH